MRSLLRFFVAAVLCAAAGAFAWYRTRQPKPVAPPVVAAAVVSNFPDPSTPTFPDPNAPGTSARVFLEPFEFDGGVFNTAARFTGELRDSSSLGDYRQAIGQRVERAKASLESQSSALQLGFAPTPEQMLVALKWCRESAFVALYAGDHEAAKKSLVLGLDLAGMKGVPPENRAQLTALLGLNALRQGEEDNCIACVGPSSCIFPIAKAAVHTRPSGSREAVRWFTTYLDEWPGDLRVRWLLNIAYMTLGEYPDKVPPKYLVPIAPFRSARAVGRFENVATLVGLAARGPDLAGGSLFDDFNGDGRPDILTTTFDVNHGASLYINRGDGMFEDRSAPAGLDDQVYALNAAKADFDNDGHLDVLLLRGAWEAPARLSLLRNKGKGVFEDVTLKSGLGDLIATESAVWGDYDDDGKLDLFVCGEYQPKGKSEPDPRNLCRLYHNQGDGTFVDVAAEAGVLNERWAKGSAWGDFDDDGKLDLFVSNMGAPPRLYHNEGDGHFRDMAPKLGITGPPHGFNGLFWDYDNDGKLDILVSDWGGSLAEVVAAYMGLPVESENHARLYHNLGKEGFREVSSEVGLARPMPVMSINIGDVDNDGDLDLHFGTGWMSLSGLVPDLTYINENGHFEDVTESSGTGHLQKGHGVSFADWDDDGDLDLFVVLGGGYPGDRGYNALFQNPGNGRHWLKVKLVGATSNRSALGAKVRVDLKGPDRSIHRTIGNNGSFGGNSLVEHIGLSDATTIDRLTITWPTSRTVQTFRDVKADQSIEITERADAYKVLPSKPLPRPKP